MTNDRVVTLAVAGELDLFTASRLSAAIQNALLSQYRTELIIDLEHVTFLDCATIGVLVAGRNTAVRRGQLYKVTNPQRHVRTVLHLTGVLTALTECSRPTPTTSAEAGTGTITGSAQTHVPAVVGR